MINEHRPITTGRRGHLRSALVLCLLVAATSSVLTGVIWAAGTAMAATTSVADAPSQVAAASAVGPLHAAALVSTAVLVVLSLLAAAAATRGQARFGRRRLDPLSVRFSPNAKRSSNFPERATWRQGSSD